MKRFLIHVSTSWCGMDDTFRAMAENDYELDEIADQLAYENFQFYDCENDIAEEFGYDPDDMEDEDWINYGSKLVKETIITILQRSLKVTMRNGKSIMERFMERENDGRF